MGYPASYRRTAPQEHRRGSQTPMPFNDNYRSPRKRALGTAVPMTADNDAHRRRVRLGALKNVGRLARIHPGLRVAGWVHDFYQFYTDVQYAIAAQPEGFTGGFALFHHCAGNQPPNGRYVGGTYTMSTPPYTCLAGQAGTTTGSLEAWWTRVVRVREYAIQPSGLLRHQKYDEYRRPADQAGVEYVWQNSRPAVYEFTVQNPIYEHWPYHMIPHWRRNPYLSPTEQTEKGPAPRRRAVPFAPGNPDGTKWEFTIPRPGWEDPDWDPDDKPSPGERPAPRPGFGGGGYTGEWGDEPALRTPPEIKPQLLPWMFPGPPGPGVKEKKFVIHGPTGTLHKIISVVGEGVEFIESFYDALPWSIRKAAYAKNGYRNLSPQQKLRLLYGNVNSVDWTTALKNLTLNQIEDMIFGRMGQGAADLARLAGVSHGFQLGPTI